MGDFLRVDGAPAAEAERYLNRALEKTPNDPEAVYVTGALVLPAVSLPITANRYVWPSDTVYDVGDVHGANVSALACGTSEHWKVVPALSAVKAKRAVEVVAGFGGFWVIVTTGGAALMVKANWLVLMLPAASVPCTVNV